MASTIVIILLCKYNVNKINIRFYQSFEDGEELVRRPSLMIPQSDGGDLVACSSL
jgi:hypothetical protein